MKITVTQDDIRAGERGSNCACPIALAVRRVTGLGYGSVDVDGERILLLQPSGRTRLVLPECASYFVRDFDERDPVEPFEFELAIPTQAEGSAA